MRGLYINSLTKFNMNKKCGNCGWKSDKCKNPKSVHYDEFRDDKDRCSLKSKKEVVHLFDVEHASKFPRYDENRFNATKCGYVRKNVTHDINEVTCKLCLRALNK